MTTHLMAVLVVSSRTWELMVQRTGAVAQYVNSKEKCPLEASARRSELLTSEASLRAMRRRNRLVSGGASEPSSVRQKATPCCTPAAWRSSCCLALSATEEGMTKVGSSLDSQLSAVVQTTVNKLKM